MDGFRKFILRGNVVDLAVGVVIGAAFAALISQFVDSFISPIVGLILPGSLAEGVGFSISGNMFDIGGFIDAVITFLLTALALYFVVVVPVNRLMDRRRTEPEVGATTKQCPECLSSIPSQARRCAFCTEEQVNA